MKDSRAGFISRKFVYVSYSSVSLDQCWHQIHEFTVALYNVNGTVNISFANTLILEDILSDELLANSRNRWYPGPLAAPEAGVKVDDGFNSYQTPECFYCVHCGGRNSSGH